MSNPNPYASPASPSPEIPPPPTQPPSLPQGQSLESQLGPLFQQGNNGANWFYWIAGFSIVNSLILHLGGNIVFVVGLAVTGIVDQFALIIAQQNPESALTAKAVALGWAAVVSLLVAGCGKLSRQRYLAVYAIGMALYLLDGLLFVLMGAWICVAFHAYALFSLWSGFKAYRQIQSLEHRLASNLSFSVDVGAHQ